MDQKGTVLLDMGCGMSPDIFAAPASEGCISIGVDVNQQVVNLARRAHDQHPHAEMKKVWFAVEDACSLGDNLNGVTNITMFWGQREILARQRRQSVQLVKTILSTTTLVEFTTTTYTAEILQSYAQEDKEVASLLAQFETGTLTNMTHYQCRPHAKFLLGTSLGSLS